MRDDDSIWDCPGCRETHANSLELCWKCGTSRDGTANPDFVPADQWTAPSLSELGEAHRDPLGIARPHRLESLRVGETIAATLRIALANAVPLLAITAVFLVPQFFVSLRQTVLTQQRVLGAPVPQLLVVGLILLNLVIGFVLQFLVGGAVSYSVFQRLRGNTPSIRECLTVGIRRLLPVVGVALAAGVAVVLGHLALVIPGFMIQTAFFVAGPAVVLEGGGIRESLRRSRDLTRGYRWTVLAVILLLGLIGSGLGVALTVPFDSASTMLSVGIGWFAGVVSTALQAGAMTVIYYRLRVIREAFDADEIAAIFE